MSAGDQHDRPPSGLATTQWSLVLAAGQVASPDAREALSALCRTYWYPLYAYARRRTADADQAQDLTQEFFTRLLERNLVAVADPARGRFRSFLVTAFRNFLANEWEKARAEKRGGGQVVPVDFAAADARYQREPATDLTPERLFDRQWALALLDHVLVRLRAEHVRAGKAVQFERLKDFIAGPPADGTYTAVARDLGITEGAAQVAAHRLRRRYRDLLRDEIGQTVVGPGEVDDEIRSLFVTLG